MGCVTMRCAPLLAALAGAAMGAAVLGSTVPQWSCIATSHNRAGARCPLSLGHDFSENNQFCLDSTAVRNQACKMHGHDSASCEVLAQAHGMECNAPRWRLTKGRTSLGQIGESTEALRDAKPKPAPIRGFSIDAIFAEENAKYVAALSQDEQEKLDQVEKYCNMEPLGRDTGRRRRYLPGVCKENYFNPRDCTKAKLNLIKNGQYDRGVAYARRAEIPPGHGATRSPSITPPCKGDQGSCEWEYTWDNCKAKKKLECTIHAKGATRAEYCDAAASEDMDTVVVCCKAELGLTHWNGVLIESSNRKGAMKDCGVKGKQLRI